MPKLVTSNLTPIPGWYPLDKTVNAAVGLAQRYLESNHVKAFFNFNMSLANLTIFIRDLLVSYGGQNQEHIQLIYQVNGALYSLPKETHPGNEDQMVFNRKNSDATMIIFGASLFAFKTVHQAYAGADTINASTRGFFRTFARKTYNPQNSKLFCLLQQLLNGIKSTVDVHPYPRVLAYTHYQDFLKENAKNPHIITPVRLDSTIKKLNEYIAEAKKDLAYQQVVFSMQYIEFIQSFHRFIKKIEIECLKLIDQVTNDLSDEPTYDQLFAKLEPYYAQEQKLYALFLSGLLARDSANGISLITGAAGTEITEEKPLNNIIKEGLYITCYLSSIAAYDLCICIASENAKMGTPGFSRWLQCDSQVNAHEANVEELLPDALNAMKLINEHFGDDPAFQEIVRCFSTHNRTFFGFLNSRIISEQEKKSAVAPVAESAPPAWQSC